MINEQKQHKGVQRFSDTVQIGKSPYAMVVLQNVQRQQKHTWLKTTELYLHLVYKTNNYTIPTESSALFHVSNDYLYQIKT